MSSILLLQVALLEGRNEMNGAKIKIPKEFRATMQRAWNDERKERIGNCIFPIRISLAATYILGAVGIAGYFNWANESIASYSKLFFNASLLSAVVAGRYHHERKELIRKKRLSEDEIYDAFISMQAAKKVQKYHV